MEHLAPCLADHHASPSVNGGETDAGAEAVGPEGMLTHALAAIDDVDGARLPSSLPPVIDAHVHVFPDPLFAAIRRWFDAHGWPIRYALDSAGVIDFQLSRGVSRIVALTYAHKPGMARDLNRYVADLVVREPRVIGLGTVFPGEEGARAIVDEAFALGLSGIKMHCHVQCFAPDDARLDEIYEACATHDKPLVMHAGREPKSPAYACDPYALCSADRIERVLVAHPKLCLVVPHLGADEFDAYERLLARHDNLWLDTTMAVSGYLPGPNGRALVKTRPERILHGTDFPNIPYAWDRELRVLTRLGLREEDLARVLGANAEALFLRG